MKSARAKREWNCKLKSRHGAPRSAGVHAAIRWFRTSSFPRFVVIGGLGFLVDWGVLELLTRIGSWNPFSARAVSFAIAVATTWALSRAWGFHATRSPRMLPEAIRYVAVQLVGGSTNLITYSCILALYPALSDLLLAPIAAGSAVGIIVNYTGAKMFVFRGR